jgi:DNA gyrase subunit A
VANGVRGMKLKSNDQIVYLGVMSQDEMKENTLELLVITDKGYGKRTNVNQYKLQNRGGIGIRTAHVTEKTGPIVDAMIVNSVSVKNEDLIVISEQGQVIRLPFSSISVLGRDTQGVKIMRIDSGDSVASITMF